MFTKHWGFSFKGSFPGSGFANALIKLVPGNKEGRQLSPQQLLSVLGKALFFPLIEPFIFLFEHIKNALPQIKAFISKYSLQRTEGKYLFFRASSVPGVEYVRVGCFPWKLGQIPY